MGSWHNSVGSKYEHLTLNAIQLNFLQLFDELSPWVGGKRGIAKFCMKVLNKERPRRSDYPQTNSVPGLWSWLDRCWVFEPQDRITIRVLAASIQQISI